MTRSHGIFDHDGPLPGPTSGGARPDADVVTAFAWLGAMPNSFCDAALLACDDGNDYVVKGAKRARRTIVTDHVLGRLGAKCGAPVGEVRMVFVPQELIEGNPVDMGHFDAGVAHGCLFVEDCYDAHKPKHYDVAENRARFASLAIFYGWTFALDHQYCYRRSDRLVFSFDHGHFLPNGPLWRRDILDAHADDPRPDVAIVEPCGLDASELTSARGGLAGIDEAAIADVISHVPDGWGGVDSDDLRSLAGFLHRRCESMKS